MNQSTYEFIISKRNSLNMSTDATFFFRNESIVLGGRNSMYKSRHTMFFEKGHDMPEVAIVQNSYRSIVIASEIGMGHAKIKSDSAFPFSSWWEQFPAFLLKPLFSDIPEMTPKWIKDADLLYVLIKNSYIGRLLTFDSWHESFETKPLFSYDYMYSHEDSIHATPFDVESEYFKFNGMLVSKSSNIDPVVDDDGNIINVCVKSGDGSVKCYNT